MKGTARYYHKRNNRGEEAPLIIFQYNTTMKKQIPYLIFLLIPILSGCTQIVTAPISLASTVVSSTIDVAGAAGGAVVNTVTGGSDSGD